MRVLNEIFFFFFFLFFSFQQRNEGGKIKCNTKECRNEIKCETKCNKGEGGAVRERACVGIGRSRDHARVRGVCCTVQSERDCSSRLVGS